MPYSTSRERAKLWMDEGSGRFGLSQERALRLQAYTLARLERGQRLDLVGAQFVGGGEILGHVVAQQDRRTLAFIIAEIGPMQLIAHERRQSRGKMPRDRRRVDEELVLVGLQPAKAVADDHAGAWLRGAVRAGAVQGRTEKEEGRARIHFRRERKRAIHAPFRLSKMALRPHHSRAVLRAIRRERPHDVDQILDLADRKSTRLNSSHPSISYAVFCLKKKKKTTIDILLQTIPIP